MGLTLNTGLRLRPGPFGPVSLRTIANSPPSPDLHWYCARSGTFFLSVVPSDWSIIELVWDSDPFRRDIAYWSNADILLTELRRLPLPPAAMQIHELDLQDPVRLRTLLIATLTPESLIVSTEVPLDRTRKITLEDP